MPKMKKKKKKKKKERKKEEEVHNIDNSPIKTVASSISNRCD
jgi:hypothetical protein